MNEITDKTYVVMLKGGYKCYLNEKQKTALENDLITGKQFSKIDDFLFKANEIIFVLPAREITREERIKKGDYKCNYETWHSFRQICDCGEAKKWEIL